MNDTTRSLAAGVAGALVTAAVVVAQPAVADQAERARARITSAMIKNGTIQPRDLNRRLTTSMGKADTALQAIADASVTGPKLADGSVTSPKVADGSVTGPKLADGSVTGPKVADGSVTGSKLADGSVTGPKLVDGSVTGPEVADGSLTASDVAASTGRVTVNFPNLATGTCAPSTLVETGQVVTGGLLLVSAPATVVGSVQVFAREATGSTTAIQIVACNSGGAFDPPSTAFTWAVIAP